MHVLVRLAAADSENGIRRSRRPRRRRGAFILPICRRFSAVFVVEQIPKTILMTQLKMKIKKDLLCCLLNNPELSESPDDDCG